MPATIIRDKESTIGLRHELPDDLSIYGTRRMVVADRWTAAVLISATSA